MLKEFFSPPNLIARTSTRTTTSELLNNDSNHLQRNRREALNHVCNDDDSTTRSNLQHSFENQMEWSMILEIPLTKKGNHKKDNGKLSLKVPPIRFFCDKNHRSRNYGKQFWKLESLPQCKSECDKSDARRLQKNFSYAI